MGETKKSLPEWVYSLLKFLWSLSIPLAPLLWSPTLRSLMSQVLLAS